MPQVLHARLALHPQSSFGAIFETHIRIQNSRTGFNGAERTPANKTSEPAGGSKKSAEHAKLEWGCDDGHVIALKRIFMLEAGPDGHFPTRRIGKPKDKRFIKGARKSLEGAR
jgi:hypothetical protein